ncbi:hypothetical protein C2E23DRAFT_698627, partial [Lenzites betulinus]
QLFDARLSIIMDTGLDRHLSLFERLSPCNMSGDETDGARRKLPMAYRIVESRWQSDALKTFMRALDAIYRGNPPRTRISRPEGRVEDGYAPRGLWRNCYNEEWLQELAPYHLRALAIENDEYDFDL